MASMGVDYAAVIADLESKIAVLQAALASLKAIAGGALEKLSAIPTGAGGLGDGPEPLELPKGALLGKTLPDAIKLYLGSVKKKQTNKQIADALREAGVESKGSNFYGLIGGALFRLKTEGEVLRFKEGWALASLYPPHLRTINVEKPKSKGKKKKTPKGASAKKVTTKAQRESAIPPTPVEVKAPQPQKAAGGGLQKAVADLIRSNPARVFRIPEIVEKTKGERQSMSLLLGRLAAKGLIQKTQDGGYLAPGVFHPGVVKPNSKATTGGN